MKFHTLCIALVVVSAFVGCGKKSQQPDSHFTQTSGIVTFDGKPLPGGSVTIISAKDSLYRGMAAIGDNGIFRIRNAPVGDVLIAVDTVAMQRFAPNRYVPIPAKYAKVATSGLTANITTTGPSKDNDKDNAPQIRVELKSK
jgi:hypothetical protein